GGGIYNNGDLFIYGSTIIGETSSSVAQEDSCSNKATNGSGGAIYNSGKLYLGYSSKGTDETLIESNFTGGIYYNYASSNGGGIYNCPDSISTIDFKSGNISYNCSKENGGAIYLANQSSESYSTIMTMTGGNIIDNSSQSKIGGAICLGYNYVTLSLGGTSYIPFGTEIGKNDIYLLKNTDEEGTENTINLISSLTASYSNANIGVNIESLTNGRAFVSADADSYTIKESDNTIFKIVNDDNDYNKYLKTSDNQILALAPYYVAGSGYSVCSAAGDDENGTGSKTKPLASVGEAISLILNTNDGTLPFVIYLDGTDNSVSTSRLNLSETTLPLTLTIKAPGSNQAVLNGYTDAATETKGSYNGALFSISGRSSTETIINLENITITGHQNPSSSGTGGALYCSNAKVTLNNCQITNNQAASGAGLAVDNNAYLIMDSSTIENNTANESSGSGGGLYLIKTAKAELTNTTIKSNQAYYGGGIGFNLDANSKDLTLTNCTISGNTANSGGGLYVASGTCTMAGGSVSGNTATSNGGGVAVSISNPLEDDTAGSLYLCGTAVIGDSTKTLTPTSTDGEHSNTAVNGAGIYSSGGNVYIGYLSEEQVDSNFSGGIYYNYASSYGGGVYNSNSGTLTMSKGNISNNYANCGGGVYTLGSLYLCGTAVIGDSTKTLTSTSTDGEHSNSAQKGAGIYSSGGNVYIGYTSDGEVDSDFSGGIYYNYASSDGGGVYNSNSGTLTMSKGTVAYNKGTTGGGMWNSATLNINGGSISYNKGNTGGGISNSGTFNMTSGSIAENSASNMGGAVYLEDEGTPTFNISGSAYIPTGCIDSDGNLVTTSGNNDVYLPSGKVINIAATLNPPSECQNGIIGSITPGSYSDEIQVLNSSADTLIAGNYQHFQLTSQEWTILQTGYLYDGYTIDDAIAALNSASGSISLLIKGDITEDNFASLKTAITDLYNNYPDAKVNLSLYNTSITSLPYEAFLECYALSVLILPNTITSLSYRSLRKTSLTSITLPSSVTYIGESCFSGCTSLESITIPNGVGSISANAFNGCTSLTSIVLPSNITNLGAFAFSKCTSLTDITFNGTTEQWNNIDKNSTWKNNVPATQVTCSDGTISL
ncbi:MAG: leucine-rich repeat domain-containing protein, partial [Treponema sp.]|nr:leucine-rich repeat domain-containing protein [Treponema sp.]